LAFVSIARGYQQCRLKEALASCRLERMSAQGATAFVFAGGSSLGALQVGMLKALLARGIAPDFVVGASAGAINAAYFAWHPTMAGVAEMDRLWRRLKRNDIFRVSPLGGLWGLLVRRPHMSSADGLLDVLQATFSSRLLEAEGLPCCIITTDMLTGCEYRIRSGLAVPALLASAAIPGVFPPVRLHGKYLVDGGITNHTPLSAALDLGAQAIFVMPTGYSCALSEPPKTAIGIALHGLNLLIAQQLKNDVRHLRSHADIRVVPPPCPQDVSPYDFSRAGELIDRAEELTNQWLDEGVEMVDGVPHQLPPHTHNDAQRPYGPHWQQQGVGP
jgi:NTE family protein